MFLKLRKWVVNFDPRSTGFPHAFTHRVVFEEMDNRSFEFFRSVRVNEYSRLAIHDNFRSGSFSRRDDNFSKSHGLDINETEAFLRAGHDEDVARIVVLRKLPIGA